MTSAAREKTLGELNRIPEEVCLDALYQDAGTWWGLLVLVLEVVSQQGREKELEAWRTCSRVLRGLPTRLRREENHLEEQNRTCSEAVETWEMLGDLQSWKWVERETPCEEGFDRPEQMPRWLGCSDGIEVHHISERDEGSFRDKTEASF